MWVEYNNTYGDSVWVLGKDVTWFLVPLLCNEIQNKETFQTHYIQKQNQKKRFWREPNNPNEELNWKEQNKPKSNSSLKDMLFPIWVFVVALWNVCWGRCRGVMTKKKTWTDKRVSLKQTVVIVKKIAFIKRG